MKTVGYNSQIDTHHHLQGLLSEVAHMVGPLSPVLGLARGSQIRLVTRGEEHWVDDEQRRAGGGDAVHAAATLALGSQPGGWLIEGPWQVGEETLWVLAARPEGEAAESQLSALRLVGICIREALQARNLAASLATELDDLQAISQIASIARSGLQLEHVLRATIETVGALTGADSGGCLLYEDETDELVLKHPAFGFVDQEQIGVYRVSAQGQSNAARVFRSGQPYMTNAASRDPRLVRRLVQAYPAGSVMTVPLQVGQNRIGVFHVISHREGAFTPRHLRLLQVVAPQLAVSIRNAQLFKLLQDQHGQLVRAQQVASDLTRTVLAGAPVDDTVRTLAASLQNGVLIFGPQRQLLTSGTPNGREVTTEPKLIARIQSLLARHRADPVQHRVGIPGHAAVDVLTVPVAAGRNHWGYLAVVGTHAPLTDADRLAVHQAALVFALEFLHRQTLAEVERKLKGDFVLELLEGNRPITVETLRRAAQLGCDLSKPHRVLALAPDPVSNTAATPLDMDGPAIQAMDGCLAEHQVDGILVACSRGQVWVLVPDAAPLLPLAHGLRKSLGEVTGRSLSAGIGRRAAAAELPLSAEDAGHCLQSIWAFGHQGTCLDYEELGIAGLLLHTANKAELVRFCRQTLDPLLTGDTYREQLLDTLWHYCQSFDHHKVAEQAHVHVNTVKYRLQRVQSVTGLDLGQAANLQRLHLAMQIYRLLGT